MRRAALVALLVSALAGAETPPDLPLIGGSTIPADRPLMVKVSKSGGEISVATDSGGEVSMLVPEGSRVMTPAGYEKMDAHLKTLETRAHAAEEQNRNCQEQIRPGAGGFGFKAGGIIFGVGVATGIVLAIMGGALK